MLRVSKMCRN